MDTLAREEFERWRNPDCLVRFWDKFYNEEGVVGDYLELQFSFKRNAAGALSMTLPGDTPFREFLLNNPDNPDVTIPITVDTKGIQWPGKVDRIALIRDENGVETIEVSALHDWEHISHICCWASPFAPLEAQFPRHMVLFGPSETVLKTFLITNLVRLQLPLWSIPYDWGDDAAWFELGNAMFPIAVVPVNPALDTTKWCALSARFEMADELFEQTLADSGLVLTAKLYIHGESEQPCPQWFVLDRTTIVLDIEDKSGVTGPTGTLVDGLISYVEEFFDDGSSDRYPILDADRDYEPEYDTGWLGTKKARPWVVYREGQYSGIGSSEVAIHKPLALDVIVGGKSPGWVNAGIELAIRNLLSWLGLLIGVPGLDALYQGQLDDVFLAFARTQDRARARRAGPYAYREHFVTGSQKAFTLDGLLALRQGNWDTRGYTSQKVTIEDGAPYIFGKHFDIGDMVGFEIDGVVYTDYITEATFTDDRTTSSTWTLVVGDGADEEDPVAKSYRKFTGLLSIVKQMGLDVGADLDLLIF